MIFKPARFLLVTVCAAIVLLVETVLFHLTSYIHDFFIAVCVIGYAVLGLGLGAFAASTIKWRDSVVFLFCAVGSTVSLYAVSLVFIWYPTVWLIAIAVAMCVFFPTIYIAVLFRNHPGGRVYFYDMTGAFLGIVATVAFYEFMMSESIILLLVCLIPLVGLIVSLRSKELTAGFKIGATSVTALLITLGATLFSIQLATGYFNIFNLFDRNNTFIDEPIEGEDSRNPQKILLRYEPQWHRASYDGLAGRVDIVKAPNKDLHVTSMQGYPNDHFKPKRHKDYAFYQKRGIDWPSRDPRVFYGLKKEPKIYIVGSSARGIIETVKKITKPEKIFPVEILPGIIEVMTKDFWEESGRAYEGLKPTIGNAISLLKTLDGKFDLITMINTHSGPNIGYPSGPDYLHTREHYDMYFDHLSNEGCILFEERPYNRSGELGIYRMMNTAWHTLKDRGAKNPSKHFLIWEWMSGRWGPNIIHDYDEKRKRYRGGASWYVGMIVSKKPLQGKLKKRVLKWYHEAVGTVRVAYLDEYLEHGEFSDVMNMIETGDFSELKKEGFDDSIVTDDRPFPSLSRVSQPRVARLLQSSTALFIVLSVVFGIGIFRKENKGRATILSTYNILIGLGYFLIEIMLIQVYQNIFVSPSWSLILVLGVLLLSSAIGGLFCEQINLWLVTLLLVPTALAAVYLPQLLLYTDLPLILCKIVGTCLIFATGFLMGFYFPRGLRMADRWHMRSKIPHVFAINSVAGSFAVVLALFLGIKIGYQATIFAAIATYSVAGLVGNIRRPASEG